MDEKFLVVCCHSDREASPNTQSSLSFVLANCVLVIVVSGRQLDHSIFPEDFLGVDVEYLRNSRQIFNIFADEGFKTETFDGFDQNFIVVFLLTVGELSIESEDGFHLLSAKSHGTSVADQADVLFEVSIDRLGYRSYQSIAVLWQLWTKIERILIDNH